MPLSKLQLLKTAQSDPGYTIRESGLWVPKGWGGEHWIVNDKANNYCAKRLFVAAGKQFSYHYHKIKVETFYVMSGSALLLFAMPGDQENMRADTAHARIRDLNEGEIIHVTPGMVHRIFARRDTWIYEASTYHMDEDSIRVEKGD